MPFFSSLKKPGYLPKKTGGEAIISAPSNAVKRPPPPAQPPGPWGSVADPYNFDLDQDLRTLIMEKWIRLWIRIRPTIEENANLFFFNQKYDNQIQGFFFCYSLAYC